MSELQYNIPTYLIDHGLMRTICYSKTCTTIGGGVDNLWILTGYGIPLMAITMTMDFDHKCHY